jgi:hypothetical protein
MMKVPLKPREVQAQIKAIYQAYPKHRGTRAARQAILKALQLIPFDDLLPRVEAYAKSVAHHKGDPDEWKYVPWPQRWFNEGRWDDELDPPPRGAPTYGCRPGEDEERKRNETKYRAEQWVGHDVCDRQLNRAADELATMVQKLDKPRDRRWREYLEHVGVYGATCTIARRIIGDAEFDRRVEAILAATSGIDRR